MKRYIPPNNYNKYSEQNPSDSTFKYSVELSDETESSSDDVDYHPSRKRPKTTQRVSSRGKKSRGRRTHKNVLKKRKEHKESSNIPTETVTASCSGSSSSLRCGIENSNAHIQQNQPSKTKKKTSKDDFIDRYLRYHQQDASGENFNIATGSQVDLFSDAEGADNITFESSQDKGLQGSGSNSSKSKRVGKNMNVLNREKNLTIQSNCAQNGSETSPAKIESSTKQNSDSDSGRDSNKMVGEFLEKIESEGHAERHSAIKSSWESAEPTTAEIGSTSPVPSNSIIPNSHLLNEEITDKELNNLDDIPIIPFSQLQNQEITDLNEKFSSLENRLHNVCNRLDELETFVKNYQIENKKASSLAEVLESGENFKIEKNSALKEIASGSRKQPVAPTPNMLQDIDCDTFGILKEEPIDFNATPLHNIYNTFETIVKAPISSDSTSLQNKEHDASVIRKTESISSATANQCNMGHSTVSGQQFIPSAAAASLQKQDYSFPKIKELFNGSPTATTNLQKQPPKYGGSSSVSSTGNMKCQAIEKHSIGRDATTTTAQRHGRIANLEAQFDCFLSVFQNIRQELKQLKNYNNQAQSTEIDDIADLQKPGPSGINQIHQKSDPSVIQHINQTNRLISGIDYSKVIHGEAELSNAGETIWGDLSYFEDSKLVGRAFECGGVNVRVDCFKTRELNKRNNGFHIGAFRNQDRSRETKSIRSKIDCGIILHFEKGELSIVNHCRCTLYALSHYSRKKGVSYMNKEKQQYCIPPDKTVQILKVPFVKKTNSVFKLENSIFESDESFFKVYISFEKDWTERGGNAVPCWLSLQIRVLKEK